jgi:hypothetical protein
VFTIITWEGTVIKTFDNRLSAEIYLIGLGDEAEDYYITHDIKFDTFPDNNEGESNDGE